MNLPESLIVVLRQPSPCFLATLMPDGSPQLTRTWVDTGISTEGAAEHIETLAQRYLGAPYPWYGGRDQVRVILTIRADKITAMG